MNQIEIYKDADNQTQLEVKFEQETVWLSLQQMATLFDKAKSTINEHILNIFEEKELKKEDILRKIGISDFSTKPTNFYNLEVIISVGYRVKSNRGTQFRQWATQRLKDYLVQGFAINQKRLDQLNKLIKVIEQTGKTDQFQFSEAKGF